MNPAAPVGPAGTAEQDGFSDISSLPAMSVDPDTGTGGIAIVSPNVGDLTVANLSCLDRRNQPGAADGDIAPNTTPMEIASLTGRVLTQACATVYGPSLRSTYGYPGGHRTSYHPSVNVTNQYRQQNNLYVQAYTGP